MNRLHESISAARRANHRKSGITLIEVMVSVFIFTIMALGVLGTFLTSRKFALSNLAQSYAQATAQSIIEQIIRIPPSVLADPAQTIPTGYTQPVAEIRLPKLTSANSTSMDVFYLPWASDSTTYTQIETTTATGLLTDAAYVVSTNTIRPQTYMKMRVNLQRDTSEADTAHRVRIVLRYQWEIPDRRNANGTPIYLSGEIRTIRSLALRF